MSIHTLQKPGNILNLSKHKYCILSIGKKINVLHLRIYFQVKKAKGDEDSCSRIDLLHL